MEPQTPTQILKALAQAYKRGDKKAILFLKEKLKSVTSTEVFTNNEKSV
jgi:hypothetical protein